MTAPRIDEGVRRLVDVTVSAIGIAALTPVMVAIGVRVRRDSPGPALFRQTRCGLHGVPFTILKFRTMSVDGSYGSGVTARGDTRVTTFGARLRASKLDELPQLINVLRGEMSLVGPRPELPQFVALWPPETKNIILSVRPGITDPIAYALRHEEELLAKAKDPEAFYVSTHLPLKAMRNAEYVDTRTLRSDMQILIQTAWSVIAHR